MIRGADRTFFLIAISHAIKFLISVNAFLIAPSYFPVNFPIHLIFKPE